ncbi:MAG: phosphopantetheine-binding protein [Methylocystis sp.]
MFEIIQSLIDQEAQIRIPAAHLTPRANLYELGMTPYTAIRLLLAVEREFRIEFPRDSLNRESMATIESIVRRVRDSQFVPAYEWREAA